MIGEFIRTLRKKHGFTQKYLANKLGISRPTYLQIEGDERDLTISQARKLAGIFNVSLENILKETESDYKVIIPETEKESLFRSNNMQIRITKKDLNKFKQVLLYVLNKVGSKPNVGETVLHKLLYFIDFDYYEKFEESLMGGVYIKNHHGPTSVELASIIKDMEKNEELESIKSEYFKYKQKKYLPLKRPDLNILSAREIEHIDDVLARLSDKNANEIEKYSHNDIPWRSANEGKPLSYESVFYRDEQYSVRNYEDVL